LDKSPDTPGSSSVTRGGSASLGSNHHPKSATDSAAVGRDERACSLHCRCRGMQAAIYYRDQWCFPKRPHLPGRRRYVSGYRRRCRRD